MQEFFDILALYTPDWESEDGKRKIYVILGKIKQLFGLRDSESFLLFDSEENLLYCIYED